MYDDFIVRSITSPRIEDQYRVTDLSDVYEIHPPQIYQFTSVGISEATDWLYYKLKSCSHFSFIATVRYNEEVIKPRNLLARVRSKVGLYVQADDRYLYFIDHANMPSEKDIANPKILKEFLKDVAAKCLHALITADESALMKQDRRTAAHRNNDDYETKGLTFVLAIVTARSKET